MSGSTHLRRLYEEADASSAGMSLEEFAVVLRETGPERHARLKDMVLARACIRGIPAAWECLSRRYRASLYAAALAISRNDSIARELADSIFGDMFLYPKLASYTGRGSLEGWLKAVLSQAYVDRYRAQRRVVSFDERLLSIRGTLFSGTTVVDFRLNDAIRDAFFELAGEERFLLAGYYFDEQTLAALARTLGVHESTVSRRLERIVRGLRRRIKELLREKGMSVREVQESFGTDVRDLTLDFGRSS